MNRVNVICDTISIWLLYMYLMSKKESIESLGKKSIWKYALNVNTNLQNHEAQQNPIQISTKKKHTYTITIKLLKNNGKMKMLQASRDEGIHTDNNDKNDG